MVFQGKRSGSRVLICHSFISSVLCLWSMEASCDLEEHGAVGVWKWKLLSRVWLFATPWTIQSMEFSRPEYWDGWPSPSPGDLPNSGIEPRSPALQVDFLPAEPQGKNTRVGSLPLLQRIFPTQQSNWGIPHHRQIHYQLRYQGSPREHKWGRKILTQVFPSTFT